MALALMEQALALLDRCDPGLVIGAHLDLTICRLRCLLGIPELESNEITESYEVQPWSDPPDSFAA